MGYLLHKGQHLLDLVT